MQSHTTHEVQFQQQLQQLIQQHPFIMQILTTLYDIEPNAYIAAGIIRNTVWAALHGWNYVLDGSEVDVIFYDEAPDHDRSNDIQHDMMSHFPHMEWDVTNQATVHHWYRLDDGTAIEPLKSIEHALSLWPETATAVAIRLNANHELEIVAPFGLQDLFELKLRWNPQLVSHAGFLKRMQTKQFLIRWPQLKWIDPIDEDKQ